MNQFESQFFEDSSLGGTSHWNDAILFAQEGHTSLDQADLERIFRYSEAKDLDTERRQELYRAAQDIENPVMATRALLRVASNSIRGLNEGNFLQDKRYRYGLDTLSEVTNRVEEAMGLIELVAGGAQSSKLQLDENLMSESLSLVLSTQEIVHSQWFNKEFALATTITQPKKDGTSDIDSLTNIAVKQLQTMFYQFPHRLFEEYHPDEGKEALIGTYLRQLYYVESSKTLSSELKTQKSDLIIEAIDKLPREFLAKSPNGVEEAVSLAYITTDPKVSKNMLDTAVWIAKNHTKQTNRSGLSAVLGSLTFGKPIGTNEDINFLASHVLGNFTELLKNYPKHIKDVVELHDIEEQDIIWYGLAERVIEACSTRGQSEYQDLQQSLDKSKALIQGFRSIASGAALAHAEYEIEQSFLVGE